MALLHILGRDWDIAPYKLGAMIEAAPLIDAQKARQHAIQDHAGVTFIPGEPAEDRAAKLAAIVEATKMTDLMANVKDGISILLIGINRIDPDVTLEQLVDDVDPTPEGMRTILTCMQAVLGKSGMVAAGETPAPVAKPDAAGALPTASGDLSTN